MSIKTIRAPIPGIFYRKPAPDQPPFKVDGDLVSVGDTLALIEVMKTFHPVKATDAGALLRFLIEDEDELMAGQPIYEIQVDGGN
jgi:biotin carboxyl carrier protein